jgi:tetratricopeptide (TPR) repeat protein
VQTLILISLVFTGTSAQTAEINTTCISEREQAIINALKEKGELPIDLVTALLIVEGVEDSSVVSAFKNKLDILFTNLEQKINTNHSTSKKSRIIFEYLHKELFKKYVTNARFQNLFPSNEYNCVTATAIFYLICRRYEMPIILYQTPTHVYSAVDPVGKKMIIELTDPKRGFDFKENKEEIIDYLLQYKFITAQELAEKGADVIYSEQIEKTEEISSNSLIDIAYFNRAIDFFSENKFEEALCSIEKALLINSGNESYQSTCLYLLSLTAPPQLDFATYVPLLERAVGLFKDYPKYQKALLPEIARSIDYFDSRQNYEDGVMFLDQIKKTVAQDSSILKTILEYNRTFQIKWASTFFLRGEYEAAYKNMMQLRGQYPNDQRVRDLYASSACEYARYLTSQGKSQNALMLLDSLTSALPDLPIVKEAYIRILLSTIRPEDFETGNFKKIKEILLKAHSLAPFDQNIAQMLVQLHHNMAMAKIREDKITEARRITEDGLKYGPTSKFLQKDLEQINELLNNMKKKREAKE